MAGGGRGGANDCHFLANRRRPATVRPAITASSPRITPRTGKFADCAGWAGCPVVARLDGVAVDGLTGAAVPDEEGAAVAAAASAGV